MLRTFQLSIIQVLFWRLLALFALICVGQLTRFLSIIYLQLLTSLFLISLLLASTDSRVFYVFPFARAEPYLIREQLASLLLTVKISRRSPMIRRT